MEPQQTLLLPSVHYREFAFSNGILKVSKQQVGRLSHLKVFTVVASFEGRNVPSETKIAEGTCGSQKGVFPSWEQNH